MWTCGTCTYEDNENHLSVCEMCGVGERPAGLGVPFPVGLGASTFQLGDSSISPTSPVVVSDEHGRREIFSRALSDDVQQVRVRAAGDETVDDNDDVGFGQTDTPESERVDGAPATAAASSLTDENRQTEAVWSRLGRFSCFAIML
jgi:hypothetical protein